MARHKSPYAIGAALLGLSFLAACDLPLRESLKPQARPAGIMKPRIAPKPAVKAPSKAALELSAYYIRLQEHLLAQGLLRRDGGGPDTGFRAFELGRNFEKIAFFNEHAPGQLTTTPGQITRFHRWRGEARVASHFGNSVSANTREKDARNLNRYLARLSRVTGHSITASAQENANFHVLFMGVDDAADIRKTVRSVWPDFPESRLTQLMALPRDIYCLVHSNVAFAPPGQERAIALIRTEHPDLMRLSCIHEEVAQGLGLSNDSPHARPSIFNDDEEFATLTTHDELLLKMLYDPRLSDGMTLAEARPTIAQIAAELTGETTN